MEHRQVRLISVLSAAIAVGSADFSERIMRFVKEAGIKREAVYEAVLQSYLFLGFPRMIEAALVFNKIYGDMENVGTVEKISRSEAEKWHQDGIKLCRRVYGKNYDRLEKRFLAVSPEVFRWMVLEGYGKVLSRPGLNQIERELAEVAALIVDKRERQLISHVLGSINVGAPMNLIAAVNDDIRPIAGDDAYYMAAGVISGIEKKNEA
ncbi:MAG: hypothetical protein AB1746_07810 [Candidatus Zixiibacteriota bacterium]